MQEGSEGVRPGLSAAPVEGERPHVAGDVAGTWPGRPALLRIGQAAWDRYATWMVVLLLAAAAALRLWPVTAAATDYDEGVYWQSLRAMAQGHPLFTSVFSSQPPVFLFSIYPIYLALGQSLTAARIGVVTFSLIGIAAAYAIGRMAAGPRAGVVAAVVLALDPLYLQESRTLQAEVPALAWALAGVALAMAARRVQGGRRHWLALAAGGVIALGVGTKLFDVVTLVPAVGYLAAPVGAVFLDGEGRVRRPAAPPLRLAVSAVLPDMGLLLIGLGLGTVLVLAPFFGALPSLYDQVVRFHLRAGQMFASGLTTNVNALANVGSEVPIELAALVALGVAVWQRLWRALPLVLWAAASLLFLLDQSPLFTHHVALLAPPLAILVAVVAVAMWNSPHATSSTGRVAGARLTRQLPAWALGIVAALALWGLIAGSVLAAQSRGPSVRQVAIADTVAATTQSGDFVLSDDEYLVALANRNMPPPFVDTSDVRIRSGYLTAGQLERAAGDASVRAVLFANGRFDEVPGFRAWVASHFTKEADFGNGVVLYAKVPRAPVAA